MLGSDRPAKDGSTSTSASSSKARLEPTARSSVTPAPDAVGTTRTASQNFQSDEDRRLAAKYGLEPRPLKQSVGGVPLVYGATPMERAQAAGEKRPQLPAKQRSSMTGRRVRVNPATPKGPARLVYPAPKKGDRAPQPAVPLVPFTRDELGLKPPQRRAWDQLVATSQQRPLTPAEIKDLAKLRTLGKKQGFKQAHLSDVRGRLSDLAARTPDEAIASAARSALGMTPMPVGRPDPNRPDEYLNRRTVDVSGTVASAEGSAGEGEDERAPSLGSLDEAADRFMQRTERAVKGGSDEPTLDDLDSLRPDHLLAKPLPDKHQTVEQINNWYMSRIDVSCLAILRAFDLKQLVRLCTLAGVTVRPSEDRGSRRTWARALVTQRWKVIVPPLDALARSDTSPIVLEGASRACGRSDTVQTSSPERRAICSSCLSRVRRIDLLLADAHSLASRRRIRHRSHRGTARARHAGTAARRRLRCRAPHRTAADRWRCHDHVQPDQGRASPLDGSQSDRTAGDSAQEAAYRRLPVSGRSAADLAPLRRIRRASGSARA